jgi:site-specific DNA-methyltransferase (adenine-specific)
MAENKHLFPSTLPAIWQGDCRVLLPTLPPGCVDAVITDPPYGAQLDPTRHAWDVWPDVSVWAELARVLTPTGLLAVSIAPHLAHLRLPAVLAAGFHVLEVLIWVYGNGRPVHPTRPKRCYDLIPILSQRGRHLFPEQARGAYLAGASDPHRAETRTSSRRSHTLGSQFHTSSERPATRYVYGRAAHPANVACEIGTGEPFGDYPHYERIFAVPRARGSDRATHPTAKPLDLLLHLIRLLSPPGALVLDPFCGGGTTGEAAVREGRRFLGIEIAEPYATAARERLRAVQRELHAARRPPAPPRLREQEVAS